MCNAAIRWTLTIACAALLGCRDGQQPSTQPTAVAPATTDTQPVQASQPETPQQDKDYTRLLAEVEAQMKETPDDPMPYYRRCQHLMKLGRYEEGYQAAKTAMSKFTTAQSSLTWMLIDSIDLDSYRIDVHFNMGPDERQPPEMGMTRPLSFRVWTKDPDRSLVQIVDYEIGYLEGKPSTAAFGRTSSGVHANFGTVSPEMSYPEIREAARKLIVESLKKTE